MSNERSFLTIVYPEDPKLDFYIQDDLEFSGAHVTVERIEERDYLLIPFPEASKVILPDTRLVVAGIEHNYKEIYKGKIISDVNIDHVYNPKKLQFEIERNLLSVVDNVFKIKRSNENLWRVISKGGYSGHPFSLIGNLSPDYPILVDFLITIERRGYLEVFDKEISEEISKILKTL